MHKVENRKKGFTCFVSLVIVGIGVLLTGCQLSNARVGQQEAAPIGASGVIQAQQALIASEFGGRIVSVSVEETDDVSRGQIVAQLDTAMVDAQIELAQAVVDMAEAGLAQIKAGAGDDSIQIARAQLMQADAAVAAATQAVSDTLALVENPQDINLQIAVAQAQLESTEHQYQQAVALKDAIEVVKTPMDAAYAEFGGGGRYRFEAGSGSIDDVNLPQELIDALPDVPGAVDGDYTFQDWELSISDGQYTLYKWADVAFSLEAVTLPTLWWQSWIGVNAADATREGVQSQLNFLYAQHAEPQMYQQAYVEALNALAQLEAQRALAQIQVDGLTFGATEEQIAVVEAQVAQAQSGLDALRRQRDMFSLTAPFDGTVVEILMVPGEVAAQGAPVVKIMDLQDLTLTVYVPENLLGQIYLDQHVQITVNSFPGHNFDGYVMYIADQAEFTPRNVATQEERVHLVFAVKIRVMNEQAFLKPGMPADVLFETSTPVVNE